MYLESRSFLFIKVSFLAVLTVLIITGNNNHLLDTLRLPAFGR